MVGEKFFILKITEVITSPQLVADTQEHPLVADFEHVGAGDIFAFSHAQVFRENWMQQFAEKFPVLEVI